MCGRVRRICWLESKAIGAADEIQRAAPGRARAAAAAGGGPVSHILQLLDRSLGGACRFTGPKAGIADGLSNFSHPARVFSDPPSNGQKIPSFAFLYANLSRRFCPSAQQAKFRAENRLVGQCSYCRQLYNLQEGGKDTILIPFQNGIEKINRRVDHLIERQVGLVQVGVGV